MIESFHNNLGKSSQRGFSLMEMLVAIVIFLTVTGAIFGLLQVGRIDGNRANRRSDMLKNARTAIHLIGRDALNAGLSYHQSGAIVPDNFLSTRLGIPNDANTARDTLPSIITGNNLFTNSINPDTTVRTDMVSFAFRDMSFNGGNTISVTGVTSGTGTPQTAQLATTSGQAASASVYDLYLVESGSSQVAVMASSIPNTSRIDISPGDPLGLNQALDGSGVNGSLLKKCTGTITQDCTTYGASLKRFSWVAYKVKSDGTLVRLTFGNNTGRPAAEQIQEQPLAYNVQNLQFRYVLEDGTITDNPSAGPDGISGTTDDQMGNLNLIRQITVTLQVESTEIDEQTRKYPVITLSGTYSIRNLEYDAG